MKTITNTNIFEYTEKSYKVSGRMGQVLSGRVGSVVTDKIMDQIESIPRAFKDAVSIKAVEAVKAGKIKFVAGPPNLMLPPFCPFILYMEKGERKILFDLTLTSYSEKTNRFSKELEYDIDIRQLYAMLVSGYVLINIDTNGTIPPEAMRTLSLWWAKMFCKVLNRHLALSTNKDRYDAFMYFTMKFFLINILECPLAIADGVAVGNLVDGKNSFINLVEGQLAAQDIDLYKDFNTFCDALFDNSITGIGGVREKEIGMNKATFIDSFIKMYGIQTLYSLATFPYFFHTVVLANNTDRGFNKRIFEDVMINPKLYARVINSLL